MDCRGPIQVEKSEGAKLTAELRKDLWQKFHLGWTVFYKWTAFEKFLPKKDS